MDDIKTYRLELAEPIDPHQTDFLTLWEPKNNWIYQFDGASPEIVYYVNGRYFRGQGGTKRQAHRPGEELVPIGVAQAEYNWAGQQVGGSRMDFNYPQRFGRTVGRYSWDATTGDIGQPGEVDARFRDRLEAFMRDIDRRDTPFLRSFDTRIRDYPNLEDE